MPVQIADQSRNIDLWVTVLDRFQTGLPKITADEVWLSVIGANGCEMDVAKTNMR